MRLPVPPLLVISDRRQARRPLEEVAEAIFAGGCRWLSLREKDLPAAERRALLGALTVLARRWQATVTVHEDIDAAAMAGAGGVHLPSAGDPKAARARLPDGLIGASAHSAAEALALLGSGADYVTVSPVFITASKPGYGPAIGLDGLADPDAIPEPLDQAITQAGDLWTLGRHRLLCGDSSKAADVDRLLAVDQELRQALELVSCLEQLAAGDRTGEAGG